MGRIGFFLIAVSIMYMTADGLKGQTLDKHKWQDRLLLIVSENNKSETFHRQLREIKKSKEGIVDRKLIVYTILPDKYKLVDFSRFDDFTDWITSKELYNRFENEDVFRLILIGLDGTIKLDRREFVSMKEVFALIDTMPMRKQELKNRVE